MGKIITTRITHFDGGISEDKRITSYNKFSITKHFDVFTYSKKLVPYYKTVADNTNANNITNFLQLPDGTFYGLGGKSGDLTKTKIYTHSVATASWANWGTPSNGESDRFRNEEVFFYYKDYIYIWSGNSYLQRFKTDGSAFNDNYYYSVGSSVVQPVHHPNDDIAYFFQDNFVHKLDNTSWTAKILTLPSDLEITAACPYGNFLAIACCATGSQKQAVVFLWDKDSSLATLTERIDFGDGEIIHLAMLDNKLIAVMDLYTISPYLSLDIGKVLIKQASGQKGILLNEIIVDDAATPGSSQVLEKTSYQRANKLYFPMQAQLNGDARYGIWVLDSNGKMTLDFVETNATSYEGIYLTGNVWWISHSGESGESSVSRTDTNKEFPTTAVSIYESLINLGDSRLTNDLVKKLIGVSVMTEPLPSAGQVVLKYRVDANIDGGSWTTIFTNTTDDSIIHEAINIAGATLPEFREIQLRIESAGGAIITGLKMKVATIDKSIY